MTFTRLLANGLGAARRHPRLILAAYLAPLVPALILVAMARSTIAPTLDFSLFSARVLDGWWFPVWRDFAPSPASDLGVVLGGGLTLMLLLTALVQVPIAAGTVEVLLEREGAEHPFFTGVAKNSGRFLRSLLWFLPTAVLVVAAVAGTAALFFKIAEKQVNARFDLVGFAAAGVLALLLLAIFHPAFSLARIAAARHGDRKTLRGFLRAIWLVFRRPGIFLPLFVSYVLLAVALHLIYTLARSPFTVSTALGILAVLLAQQLVMVVRALLQVALWGAEVAAYRTLGEPRLCEKKRKRSLLVVDEAPSPTETTAAPDAAPPQPEPHMEPPTAADDVFTPEAAS